MDICRLSDEEKYDYLYNEVIPIYKPMASLDSRIAIMDWKLKVLWLTETAMRFLGFDKEALYSERPILDLHPKLYAKICANNNLNGEELFKLLKRIAEILQSAIDNRKTVNFTVLLPLHKSLHGYGRTAIPIVHPNGEILGLQMTGYRFSLFGIQEFIEMLNKGTFTSKKFLPESAASEFYKNLKLSSRQKEVLFLVSQGISQEYSAQILGIKRGTLSKIITDQICPKFDIFPPHYITLLEIVRREELDQYIPETFWRPYVMEY